MISIGSGQPHAVRPPADTIVNMLPLTAVYGLDLPWRLISGRVATSAS